VINLYNKNLNKYANENRKAGNLSEALLWNELKRKQLGYMLTKQKPIGNYIVDFYCKELKLVIEIDGDSHDNKIKYDKKRDEYMNGLGIMVIRIEDIDVKKNMNTVLEIIKQTRPVACVATPPLAGNTNSRGRIITDAGYQHLGLGK
jgi:very-short-patch-repair endonuclease